MIQGERRFGDLRLFAESKERFFDLPIKSQARNIGYSHACPVVERLLNERDPRELRDQYAQLNAVAMAILDNVRLVNPYLADKLVIDTKRIHPIGDHDLESIPERAKDFIIGTNNAYMYGLTRVFADFVGIHPRKSSEAELKEEQRTTNFANRALAAEWIEQSAKGITDPALFAARFYDKVIRHYVNQGDGDLRDKHVVRVLQHALSSGKAGEDNETYYHERVINAPVTNAGAGLLLAAYYNLTEQELAANGIINFHPRQNLLPSLETPAGLD